MTHSEILQTTDVVSAAIRAIWPQARSLVVFSPLVNLQYGDIGTDFLIELSGELKEAPDALHEPLLGLLRKHAVGERFSYSHGYINYVGDVQSLVHEEPSLESVPESALIIIPGRAKEVDLAAHLRVLCAAALHAQILLRCGVNVVAATAGGKSDLTLENSRSVFQSWCRSAVESGEMNAGDIVGILNESIEERIFIWLAPGTYPRKQFQAIVQHPSRVSGRTALQTPDATWCSGFEISPAYLMRLEEHPDVLENAWWYFSSPQPGLLIDPEVIFLPESDNTRWFIDFLKKRIGCIEVPPSAPALQSVHHQRERDLLVRSKYMRAYRAQAAVTGRISDYVEVVEDLLRKTTRIYNDPAFRARLRDSGASYERQILSGAWRALTLL